MSIDAEKLLEPISIDNPCGENLEYDSVAMELETVAKGRPPTQWDPGEEPDWRQVKSLCLDLLGRTKDIRFAVQLARSSVQTEGYQGFRDCLQLIHGYLEQYWDEVYPQLDPDDDNDPMFRVNAISALTDRETVLDVLESGELAAAQGIGRFTYRDLLIAQGERHAREGEESPDRGLVDAAFMGCDLDAFKARGEALDAACQLTRSIETTLTDRVGAGQACSLDGLHKHLRNIAAAVNDGLAKRGVTVEAEEEAGDAGVAGGVAPAAGVGGAAGLNGAVQNRQDVIKAIDKILDYYRTQEPSSPIPLLLKGAKRLTTMSFLEIVNDVTPEGLEQLKSIAGITGMEEEPAAPSSAPAAESAGSSGW